MPRVFQLEYGVDNNSIVESTCLRGGGGGINGGGGGGGTIEKELISLTSGGSGKMKNNKN